MKRSILRAMLQWGALMVLVLAGGVVFPPPSFPENLRNCPATILIQSFEDQLKYTDEERSITPHLGGSATDAFVRNVASALSERLPRARVVSALELLQEETAAQKMEPGTYSNEEDAARDRERHEKFTADMTTADFVIDGKLGKVGTLYVLAVSTPGFHLTRTFGSLLEMPALAEEMADRIADQLKDSFYCVTADPAVLFVDKEEGELTAEVVNLADEPVSERKVMFEPKDPGLGTMRPEAAELDGGEARSGYVVIAPKPNSVKVSVKPSGRCSRAIVNGLWVPVKTGLTLLFEGDSEAVAELSAEEVSINGSYRSHISDGRVKLAIDEKSGEITGNGYCYVELEIDGIFTGSMAGGQSGGLARERVDASVSGTITDNEAELYMTIGTPAQPVNAHMWGTSGSDHTEVDMSVSEDASEITVKSQDKTLGPVVSDLETPENQEIGPVNILLEEGETATVEGTPSSPTPEIRQHYRYDFKLE